MQILSQRDDKWGNLYLGTSNTKVRDFGCTITCLAMIIGTTPDVVNQRLRDVNGFAQGNLLIWAKIPEAFPGITINRVWSYNNDDVKANVPNVLVEVPPNAIGGVSGKHWVVFIGDQNCNDPWTGSIRPTNDFLKYGDATGYCTVSGKWNNPISTGGTITISQDLYKQLVTDATHWKDDYPPVAKLLKDNEEMNIQKDAIIAQGKEIIDDLKKQLNTCQVDLNNASTGGSTPPQVPPNCDLYMNKLLKINTIANSSWLTWLKSRQQIRDLSK